MAQENGRPVSVLIVDDEPDLREMLALEFGRHGFQIHETPDGDAALDALERCSVDVIISDIRMPGLDGLELLDAIKARDVQYPAVMLMSAYSDIPPELAYDRGAEAIFAKPFPLSGMVKAICRLAKPLEERFGLLCQEIPQHRFEFHIDDFQAAAGQKRFGMGRGGLSCTLQSHEPRANQCVEFCVSIDGGPLSVLSGFGVIRWVRRNPTQGHPPVCGVEFLQLADDGRDEFHSWTQETRPKAYIPCLCARQHAT